ncbi:MAG: hypothetical protein ACK5H2_12570 [Beutenbergiaceae bacterium]
MGNVVLELGKQAATLGVKSAYGEAQDVDGVSVVPVALSFYGFGAGEDGDASGGGGGGTSIPIGAYVRRGENLRFEPNPIPLALVGIPFVWVAGRALAHLIRTIKR